MLAYGIIFCNMNYMSRYETILHIMKGYVPIWNHNAQYEPYVDKRNNIAYMLTYGSYIDLH